MENRAAHRAGVLPPVASTRDALLVSLHQDCGIFGQAVCNNRPDVSQVATVDPDKIINIFIYARLGDGRGAYFDV
jgi:hypothetical protein